MVYRVFVEKKPGLAPEAAGLLADCRNFLGLDALKNVRILNRYDVSGIDAELFDYAALPCFPNLSWITSLRRQTFPMLTLFSQLSLSPVSLTNVQTPRHSVFSFSARESVQQFVPQRSMLFTVN